MRFQWQQFIVLIIAFGVPALSWAFGKLREQYEKKRRADAARVREEESIRVQRTAERLDVPSPQTAAQQRIEELAARRQAQLEELRRRRAGAEAAQSAPRPQAVVLAPTQTPQRAPGPAQQGPMRPGVPGTPMRVPGPAAPRPGVPQGQGSAPRPVRPPHQQQPQTPRQRAPGRQGPARTAVASTVSAVQQEARAAAPKQATPSAPSMSSAMRSPRRPAGAAMSPAEAARAMLVGDRSNPRMTAATAIALSEILSKPVSLRGNPFDDRS